MEFFCGKKRETFTEVEAHLVTEDTDSACACAVAFLRSIVEDKTEEILISLQNPVI